MGYTTIFDGQIGIEPPLNGQEVTFLEQFADTRRMERTKGPYCVEGGPHRISTHTLHAEGGGDITDITNANKPPEGQPGLWCQWIPTEEGDGIEWDGIEKFYEAAKWMQYLLDHFIGKTPLAKLNNPEEFGFLQGHTCNGGIYAQGEEPDDMWKLEVVDGVMSVKNARVTYE